MFGTNLKQIWNKKIIFLLKIALISVNIIFIIFIKYFIVSLNYILLTYSSRNIIKYFEIYLSQFIKLKIKFKKKKLIRIVVFFLLFIII